MSIAGEGYVFVWNIPLLLQNGEVILPEQYPVVYKNAKIRSWIHWSCKMEKLSEERYCFVFIMQDWAQRTQQESSGWGQRKRDGKEQGDRSNGMEQGSWMDGRDEEKKRVVVVV